eukprot:990395-Pelagomonas_calceolata.AAC.3
MGILYLYSNQLSGSLGLKINTQHHERIPNMRCTPLTQERSMNYRQVRQGQNKVKVYTKDFTTYS